MSRPATPIVLMDDDRKTLEKWLRSSTTEQRFVLRSKIILLAADGLSTKEISERLEVRQGTVSDWRIRFAAKRLEGLQDAPRPGKPKRYDDDTELRILKQLDEDPPPGHATWTGNLVAKALGDVSEHQVWACYANTEFICNVAIAGASVRTPNLQKKPQILSGCICHLLRTPLSLVWMKNLRSKPLSGLKDI